MQACTVRITDPPIHIHQQRINTGGIDVQRVAVTTMDTGSEGKRGTVSRVQGGGKMVERQRCGIVNLIPVSVCRNALP